MEITFISQVKSQVLRWPLGGLAGGKLRSWMSWLCWGRKKRSQVRAPEEDSAIKGIFSESSRETGDDKASFCLGQHSWHQVADTQAGRGGISPTKRQTACLRSGLSASKNSISYWLCWAPLQLQALLASVLGTPCSLWFVLFMSYISSLLTRGLHF